MAASRLLERFKSRDTFHSWRELKTAVPGLGNKVHLLGSPLAVPAHQESEAQVRVGAVLARRRRPSFRLLPVLHLHVLQSGVVHHHEALLAGRKDSYPQIIFAFGKL